MSKKKLEINPESRVSYYLPSGAHASFVGEPDAKTIDAVNEMVKLAKKMKFKYKKQ